MPVFNVPCAQSFAPTCDCELGCWQAVPFDSDAYVKCLDNCAEARSPCSAVEGVNSENADCLNGCAQDSGLDACDTTHQACIAAGDKMVTDGSFPSLAAQTAYFKSCDVVNAKCVAAAHQKADACMGNCNVTWANQLITARATDSQCQAQGCATLPKLNFKQSYAQQRLPCDTAGAQCVGPVDAAYQLSLSKCSAALDEGNDALQITFLDCVYGCTGDDEDCATNCAKSLTDGTNQNFVTYLGCTTAAFVQHEQDQIPCYTQWNTCLNSALGADLLEPLRHQLDVAGCGAQYNYCWANKCEGQYLSAYVQVQTAQALCISACGTPAETSAYFICAAACETASIAPLAKAAIQIGDCGLTCCAMKAPGNLVDPYSKCAWAAWSTLTTCIAAAQTANPPFPDVTDPDYAAKLAKSQAAQAKAVAACQKAYDGGGDDDDASSSDLANCHSNFDSKRTCAQCELDAIAVASQSNTGLYPFPPLQWWPNP